MVPNPYLAAVRSAKGSATGPAEQLKDGLKTVKSAMDGDCWQSPLADAFYAAIGEHEQTLGRCRTNAMQEFDDAIAGQPEKVEATAWQVHWRNLAGR